MTPGVGSHPKDRPRTPHETLTTLRERPDTVLAHLGYMSYHRSTSTPVYHLQPHTLLHRSKRHPQTVLDFFRRLSGELGVPLVSCETRLASQVSSGASSNPSGVTCGRKLSLCLAVRGTCPERVDGPSRYAPEEVNLNVPSDAFSRSGWLFK